MRELAQGRSLVLFEGFHYVYHPLMQRLMSLLADGELGTLQRVESTMFMSAPPADDPRWSLDLAGGALMDLGCYALHAQRVLGDFAGGEPRLVGRNGRSTSRRSRRRRMGRRAPRVPLRRNRSRPVQHDQRDLGHVAAGGREPPGRRSSPTSSTRSTTTGSSSSPVPENGPSTAADATSYTYQLQAFIDAVRDGAPYRTDADDAVATMSLIDHCYRTIGLEPRPAYAPTEGSDDQMTDVHRLPDHRLALRSGLLDRRLRCPRRPADAACRTIPTPTPSSATC